VPPDGEPAEWAAYNFYARQGAGPSDVQASNSRDAHAEPPLFGKSCWPPWQQTRRYHKQPWFHDRAIRERSYHSPRRWSRRS